MLITSFKIDHTKLKPGIYLHEIKKFYNSYVTTYDLRFKTPNKRSYLSNNVLHTLEHIIATFYSKKYPNNKIYFGPMGCQTGFYLVVYGKKTISWLEKTLVLLDRYIKKIKQVPGNSPKTCGNYLTLNLSLAKKAWNDWYKARRSWQNKY